MKTSTKLLVGAGVGAGAYAFYKAGGLYVLVLWGAALKDKLFPPDLGPPVMRPTAPQTVLTVTSPPIATKASVAPIIMTRA